MKRHRRNQDIRERIKDLTELISLAAEDLEPDLLAQVSAVAHRAKERLALNPDISVVALVGATGSGKSSLVNALVGADVAQVGVRRPTTTEALAVCGAGKDTSELLDWMGVAGRVIVPEGAGLPENVTVIDLPDIDSVDRANRQIVDRLAERVDVLVWVADPQKYADHILHHEFVRPLAHHSRVTLGVLTQTDRLTPPETQRVKADLTRLLHEDGIVDPQVIATSAVTGDGIETLRATISEVANQQKQEAGRLNGDVDWALSQIAQALGVDSFTATAAYDEWEGKLQEAAIQAAGVKSICQAVQRAYIHRGIRHCGWLPTRGIRALRADPLKRLHLQGDGSDQVHSLPAPLTSEEVLHVQAREASQAIAENRPHTWRSRLYTQLREDFVQISQELNHAISSTDLRMGNKPPKSWRFFNALQWIFWVISLAAAVWLGAIVIARNFLLLPWNPPYWEGLPIPTLLVGAGIAGTVLIALIATGFVRLMARRRQKQACRALRQAVGEVVSREVWVPLLGELQRQERIGNMLGKANPK
ncbi:MAG: 50S ribosome-binding GTPase [Actinomycetaceae bacterium]|nr:50S ribosome-binding GTPase [Actinomycetaceae bacterium]